MWKKTSHVVMSGDFIYLQLDLDLMALYVDEGQLVLHLVVNDDDIISRVGNLATGQWHDVNLVFGQGVFRLTCKFPDRQIIISIFYIRRAIRSLFYDKNITIVTIYS